MLRSIHFISFRVEYVVALMYLYSLLNDSVVCSYFCVLHFNGHFKATEFKKSKLRGFVPGVKHQKLISFDKYSVKVCSSC